MSKSIKTFANFAQSFNLLNPEIATAINELAYQGFDPEKTWQALVAKKADVTDAVFISEIMTLAIYGARFGADKNKLDTGKVKDSMTEPIRKLFVKYDVTDISTGGSGPDQVTLSRVLAVVPFVPTVLLDRKLMSPVGFVGNLPLAFAHPMGLAIMTEDERSSFYEDYKLWTISFSKVVNRKKKGYERKTDDVIWSEQQAFVDLSSSSQFTISNRDHWRNMAKIFDGKLNGKKSGSEGVVVKW